MERRLATPHMHTPSSHDVVPNRPTPSRDVEPVLDSTPATERLVSYDHAVIHQDRGLERLSAARIAENGKMRDYVWTGVWSGLAASTKYFGAFMAAALTLAVAAPPRPQPSRDS